MAKKKAAKRKKSTRMEREGFHLPIRSESEQFDGLSEELVDAWKALRAFALSLGAQEDPHTSHRSIMFGRKLCYLFVRPKKKMVEVYFFLPRALESELLKKVEPTGVTKKRFAHVLDLVHSDQVDLPLTDWLREAYQAAG
ncbi:MAG: DUF5655 domain-containing protein [Bdellovibrionota bacterium]